MAFSIEFLLDDRGASGVKQIWADLSGLGITVPQEAAGFRPSITFAHFIQVDQAAIKAELKRYATQLGAMEARLEAFGDAGGGIVAEIELSPALAKAHADLHQFLKKVVQSPRAEYLPAQWRPRIVLSPQAGQAEMLKAAPLLSQIPTPIPLGLASVALCMVNPNRSSIQLEAPLGGGNFRDRV